MGPEDSPDKMLPPDQYAIDKLLRWGIDHPSLGRVPEIDLPNWRLTIGGEVQNPLVMNWDEFLKLPAVQSKSDFHCVEGWSVLDCRWEGVRFSSIVELVRPKPQAKFVTFECADGYTTSLTLDELSGDDIVLAYKLNGKDLEKEIGGPMRLVAPSKYAYKSAMWVKAIRFTAMKEKGFWEKRGYSDSADVWKNDRRAPFGKLSF